MLQRGIDGTFLLIFVFLLFIWISWDVVIFKVVKVTNLFPARAEHFFFSVLRLITFLKELHVETLFAVGFAAFDKAAD